MAFMHMRLSKGNAVDLYIFCVQHASIVRVAMIEYFIFFISRNMTIELHMLQEVYGLSAGAETIFANFITQIDGFEFACLQTETLDWSNINNEANMVIERCNRMCKGKSKATTVLHDSEGKCDVTLDVMQLAIKIEVVLFTLDVMQLAIKTPVCTDISLWRAIAPRSTSIMAAHGVIKLQQAVRVYALPGSTARPQMQRCIELLATDQAYYNTFVLWWCMRCQPNT